MTGTTVATLVEQWRSSLSIPGKPNEWESKGLLNSIGIYTPRGVFIEPGNSLAPDSDVSALGSSRHCVVKVCSESLLHKTEAGGVLLYISENYLPAAVVKLQKTFPSAGVLVEEMVQYRGNEIIIGALYDPTFGPAVMAGAGGILTELYKDVSFRLAPCTTKEAHYMLEELTIFPTLQGYRGLSADIDSLAGTIERVAELSVHLIDRGCQLDINPIVWSQDRWVALDVKVVLDEL
jgi:succinyl-CoA synthetase beta subunit